MSKKAIRLSFQARQTAAGYGFFSLWIVGFFVFTLYPALYSIAISLNELKITSNGIRMTWKGIQYYHNALRSDTVFTTALMDAAMFILCSTPVIVIFALVIALFLTKKYPLRTFFKGVFFLPVIVMSGPVISELLSKHSINLVEASPLLYDLLSSLPAVFRKPVFFVMDNLVLILWFSGVQILLFIAALQKIDPEIYNAASVDGATAWEKFWKITLPHIMPFAMLSAVYTVMEVANYANLSINEKSRATYRM